MIIYVEKKVRDYPLTQEILSRFSQAEIVEIQHYKNLFDKRIGDFPMEPCIMLAKQEHIALLESPDQYGFPGKSFFFKPSINCLFDCTYCYLKGAFTNSFPVIFVNYEEMQEAIVQQINVVRASGYAGQITFYASNYADLLAIEHLTHFHQHFLPFFEQFDNVVLETRTKSANIEGLNSLAREGMKFTHTEIAFSLSPESVARRYENGTAPLEKKLHAIQELLRLGYRVGLRFLPLLPVPNYLKVYQELILTVKERIDVEKISSICIAPLLYNTGDYAVMKKNHPFPFLDVLKKDVSGMMKMDQHYYREFEQLFCKHFPHHPLYFDYT